MLRRPSFFSLGSNQGAFQLDFCCLRLTARALSFHAFTTPEARLGRPG